jgi:hypothetical protein
MTVDRHDILEPDQFQQVFGWDLRA